MRPAGFETVGAGTEGALAILRAEIDMTLLLMGVSDVAELDRGRLLPPAWAATGRCIRRRG
jgi:isopentenyl diphosphate isomerase/L-lactate dehydrogenase-like FMN-dependent dehydrogenase